MHSALFQKYFLMVTLYSKCTDAPRISARHFVKYAHGQGLVNARLQVSYARQEHTDAGITMHDNSWVQAEKNRLAESITIARMNRLIKSCGGYAADARSILDRMKFEGLTPTRYTITHVLQALHDATPPQAERAEHLLLHLCYDDYGNIKLTPHMVNLVIDAWCLVENMRRAEVLAQKMDEEQAIWIKPDQFQGTESEKGFYFPAPNYETYEILAAGWQRLGMADEVGELRKVYWWQRAFKKQGSDTKSKSLAGTRGAVEDAASVIGTWGRRRSGFMGEKGSGMFQPKREDHIKKGKGGLVRNVYRNFFWRPLY
jgi:hypothetical protein